jgi:hypothetical protein
VVAGDGEDRRAQGAQEGPCALVLVPVVAVREIAARDDELGCELLDEAADRNFHDLATGVVGADVEIGDV